MTMNLTQAEHDLLEEKANEFAETLSELGADSVCIFTTSMRSGATDGTCIRVGNYYAQRGLVADWLQHGKNEDLAETLENETDE